LGTRRADYLNLQAEGPVPWRKEIEEGIRDCAKFVAFIDTEYLLSFNCLQVCGLLSLILLCHWYLDLVSCI
jgi:hypothetical protein